MTITEKLVREFADNVMAQTDSIKRGDAKTGNRCARRYIKAFEDLRALGNEGRDALAPLMFSDRDDVRLMAATFLLRHRHQEARSVLEELATVKGFVGLGASQALKRWEEGTWHIDIE